MTEPMTILKTPKDVINAPTSTILCEEGALLNTLVVGIHPNEYLIEKLPLRVLRWGKEQYPTGFEEATPAYLTMEERERRIRKLFNRNFHTMLEEEKWAKY